MALRNPFPGERIDLYLMEVANHIRELEIDELKKRLAEEKASDIKGEVRVRWRYDDSGRGDS